MWDRNYNMFVFFKISSAIIKNRENIKAVLFIYKKLCAMN